MLKPKSFNTFTRDLTFFISFSYENSMKSYLNVHMGQNVFTCTQISLVDRRDLGTRENICIIWTQQLETLPGSSGKGDNVSHVNRTKLFGESKCFLANWDYLLSYEQASRGTGKYKWLLYYQEMLENARVQGVWHQQFETKAQTKMKWCCWATFLNKKRQIPSRIIPL